MPRFEPVHTDDHRNLDDGRRSTRGLRRDSQERARARELLGTDFVWSDPASKPGRIGGTESLAPPRPRSPSRSWDDAIELDQIERRPTPPAPVRAELVEPDTSGPEPGAPGRRTIVTTGRGAERYVEVPRRGGYDARVRAHERSGYQPDRVAMWAVLLGLALLLGAATSSHAAVLHVVAHHAAILASH